MACVALPAPISASSLSTKREMSGCAYGGLSQMRPRLLPQAVVVAREEAGCANGLLRERRGGRIEFDRSQARSGRLDVLGRRVPLVLAGELRAVVASFGRPLDI